SLGWEIGFHVVSDISDQCPDGNSRTAYCLPERVWRIKHSAWCRSATKSTYGLRELSILRAVLGSALPRIGCHHEIPAQRQWVRNVFEWRTMYPSAGDNHGAKVEQASENALIDLNAFYFLQEHFRGAALD